MVHSKENGYEVLKKFQHYLICKRFVSFAMWVLVGPILFVVLQIVVDI